MHVLADYSLIWFHCQGVSWLFFLIFLKPTPPVCGSGSSVSTATDYGLEGPGLNPGGDEIFPPSRPARGPTQPPVKWVPGLSGGVKCSWDVLLTTHPRLVPWSWKSRAISLPTHWACKGITLPFFTYQFKGIWKITDENFNVSEPI
jgi:hypothetical protein